MLRYATKEQVKSQPLRFLLNLLRQRKQPINICKSTTTVCKSTTNS